MPNETWQSDFTHYRLTRLEGRPGIDVEIISWLDDCTRYALHVTAHTRVTTPIVLATFRETLARHGIPASTLTDNGRVYTVRLAGHGRQGGKNSFEAELARRHIVQKNSRPGHPTTCGKAERFQQTMKKWLRAQPRAGPALPGTHDPSPLLRRGQLRDKVGAARSSRQPALARAGASASGTVEFGGRRISEISAAEAVAATASGHARRLGEYELVPMDGGARA